MPIRLAVAGTIFIFGGEIFCLVGPRAYEHIVHLGCHAILYTGIALVGVATGLHLADRFRRS